MQFPKFQRRGLSSTSHFVVSILGPPNAGKSTLFNRLQCKEKNKAYLLGSSSKRARGRISSQSTSNGTAIVSPIANTTRDRRQCWGRIGGTEFALIDTAGVNGDRIQLLGNTKTDKHSLEKSMMSQTVKAAKEADLVLLMWDAKDGISHDLMATARWLRKLGMISKVAILANKLEGDSWAYQGSSVMKQLEDASRLGLGEAIPISALQGEGMADIALLIEEKKQQKLVGEDTDEQHRTNSLEKGSQEIEETKPLQMAVLGRQNVGKSTLINTLIQDDRVLTGPTPGLTRDAISIDHVWDNKAVQLVDTAGIRKFTKRLDESIEDMSVADALRAMKVAEVGVLVLDAQELYIHRQELAICSAIINEGRALVIAANKMDLLEMSSDFSPDDFADGVRKQLEDRIPILRNTPVVPMSCLTAEGVCNLLPVVMDAKNRWSRTVSTGLLNRWLKEVAAGTPPPVIGGIRAKLKYIIQAKGRPPTFLLFCNLGKLPGNISTLWNASSDPCQEKCN
eukprot:scaffold9159_cov121-Cylindrotheca_fusiformis.AAC.3